LSRRIKVSNPTTQSPPRHRTKIGTVNVDAAGIAASFICARLSSMRSKLQITKLRKLQITITITQLR